MEKMSICTELVFKKMEMHTSRVGRYTLKGQGVDGKLAKEILSKQKQRNKNCAK